MCQTPQILFDKLPASGGERGIGISRFKGNINHDTANNATLANLYEQDKESIQTGFAIGKGLSQNFATFMNTMAKDMDSVAKSPAVGKDGKPIIKNGKQLTNQEAYQAGLELGDTVNKAGDTINYGTRQDLWGSGGTGNRIATALIGANSGNVSNGASTLLQNTALNVVRTYGATEIKHLADGFSTQTDDKGNPIPNGTSETVRGLLHAIAGCAGASATGGDCASAGLASAGTVAMNNAMTALLNLNPNDMTDTQKQAYSNLIGTLVAGVSTAVGGDAAAAALASKTEVEDNWLNAPDAAEKRRLELRMGQSPSEAEIKRLAVLINRDLKNNKDYAVACKDKNSNTCKQYVATQINNAIATYYGGGANGFNKDEYREIANIQYRVTQAWSAADRKQNQAITQNMTNAIAAMNDPANQPKPQTTYRIPTTEDYYNQASALTPSAYQVAGVTPPYDLRPEYKKLDDLGTASAWGSAASYTASAFSGPLAPVFAANGKILGWVSTGAAIGAQLLNPDAGKFGVDFIQNKIEGGAIKNLPIAALPVHAVTEFMKETQPVKDVQKNANDFVDEKLNYQPKSWE